MKNWIVIFNQHNARVLRIDEEMISQYKDHPNALINPDFSRVKSTPPQFWKMENRELVPMNKNEMAFRKMVLDKIGHTKAPVIQDGVVGFRVGLWSRIKLIFWRLKCIIG